MGETVMLAEAVACLCWGALAGLILHHHRQCRIGAALRLSLGLIAVCGVILGFSRIALGLHLDTIAIEWVRFARVAGPIAACVAMAEMHRRMAR